MDKQAIVALRKALQGFLDQHQLASDVCPCVYCVKGREAIHNAWLQDHK